MSSGTVRHVANVTDWRAVCTAPDYCLVGSSVVGFDSFAFLSKKTLYSPNVNAQSVPVYRVGDMFQCISADAGAHIVAGTSLGSGFVKILDGQNNVKVNGIPLARHDSLCLINCNAAGIGGAPGKLITEKKSVTSAAPAPVAEEKAWYERMEEESERVLDEKWKGLKESANTVWQALPWTSDEATTAAARTRIGKGLSSALEGIGTLIGPSPDMVQGAYLSGNPQAIALVEEMQKNQRQAVGAIADHVKQSVSAAYDRNGTAGASAMVVTSLGIEIVGMKGAGAVANVAGKVAEIVRIAKTPLEAASLLDKEIEVARLTGKSAEEIKLLEAARNERLAQVAKEGEAGQAGKEGVHVKKAPITQNGYTYHFDDAGRVSRVEGDLKINKNQVRNQKAQLDAGGADRLADDQGGHWIGRRFDGPSEDFNHFAQNGNFNNSSYKALENSWERDLKAGKTVRVEITPSYVGDSLRPASLEIKQWIDGFQIKPVAFANVYGG